MGVNGYDLALSKCTFHFPSKTFLSNFLPKGLFRSAHSSRELCCLSPRDYGLPERGCIIFCLSDNKCSKNAAVRRRPNSDDEDSSQRKPQQKWDTSSLFS